MTLHAPIRPAMTGPSANFGAAPETMLELFRGMVRIRLFEERATELFKAGVIKGTAHSYAGEEAIAAGTCQHLGRDDFIGSYHRGHGHCIAKGASLDRMMAELMGKETGYCGGLGGSMHIADLDLNILGANGIVGATMPLGTGAALAAKLTGSAQVSIAFFGDGAANQGVFHESVNLAAVWKLPMVFVCENNQYALNTPFRRTTSVDQIAMRAGGYGIPGTVIDGNDAVEVYRVVGDAIERARAGEGPSIVEAMTWRWGPHSMRANLREPRTDEEMKAWMARDPLIRLEERMRMEAGIPAATIASIREEVAEEIAAAVAFAAGSPEPDPQILSRAVYVPHWPHPEPRSQGARELTFPEALNEAIRQEMERDPAVFMMGEDIAETGGIFQVTKGLVERFGHDRIRDTPISESTFCGAGVGAAIAGMRPIVEVQIFDFVTLMMDMIVNQAAKFRFMNGGHARVPLVIRGPQGGGIRLAAQHSQSLEAWFSHVPGLVVIAPSTPYDAKGLLTAAIRDDNPVIFLEHKMLYLGKSGPVPEESYAIPIGKAAIRRPGTDVTIIATQVMVSKALSAAVELERQGISAEVIDPRTIRPLDVDTILDSVRRTNRAVIVHEACLTGGFGAEVAALINEHAFDWLDAPVTRVASLDVPMPFNDRLESAVIPSQERIVAAVCGLFGKDV
ncbi:alpha-ketoacid dehydrogenase subunit alpha/beta [Microvirga puerhi]|uniref:2-oxoglutarate dehydrogenase E1 component n=1 Tax=Microvirga puerhi TaxID=2876078 RepID=A0ABS7VU48_9HYPH|nr:dehydrogenase E1 component subunit alpha/beta [Microvirga puerhi]MBZ6079091.1 dehydrogenase E1 component subunit alpha/beta [Microvirga puerhi]